QGREANSPRTAQRSRNRKVESPGPDPRDDVSRPGDAGVTEQAHLTVRERGHDGGNHALARQAMEIVWRRGWDSNPRCFRTPLFESGTINHSDTSPRRRIPKGVPLPS